ncbi:MAG TPA: DUF6183 family protein [Acidimicrobiales bacterium]|nr:DUF6183 family protein [Acidimicrobiales bacterium]
MAVRDHTPELVELGDVDELVRQVDRLVDARDWDGIADLRDRCNAALQRGKQLWPAATQAEYRLALQAPPSWAVSVLHPGAGRFALAPLTEAAASNHSWTELAAHLRGHGPMAALVAQERAVRGEHVNPDSLDDLARAACEIPLSIQPWEPAYALPTIEAHKLEEATLSPMKEMVIAERPTTAASPRQSETSRALIAVAGAWIKESNGHGIAVEVDGSRLDAVAAIAPIETGAFRIVDVEPAEAMRWMAWAASSGGAYGRRPGAAAGRVAAWWAAAALTDLVDDWPVDPDDLGQAIAELRWSLWDDGAPGRGWCIRLAVEDPDHDLAWALAAHDERPADALVI